MNLSQDKTKINELLTQAKWDSWEIAENMHDLNYSFLISELYLILNSLSDSLKKYEGSNCSFDKSKHRRILQAIARTKLMILVDKSYK
tara:strand:- start:60 stop:323 length:264 start_codon:yes stop_codon:yes gene_type:complete